MKCPWMVYIVHTKVYKVETCIYIYTCYLNITEVMCDVYRGFNDESIPLSAVELDISLTDYSLFHSSDSTKSDDRLPLLSLVSVFFVRWETSSFFALLCEELNEHLQ